MATLTVKDIQDLGRQIVLANPGGVRYAEIVKQIMQAHPETNVNTVHGTIANNLVAAFPHELSKPSRGLYVPAQVATQSAVAPSAPAKHPEHAFYAPFADYLQNDLQEVTCAVELGGASMGQKWGTPDVVGVYRPTTSDFVKFTYEIVAAEIKVNPSEPIVAFGQASAYRLFATQSFIVMPMTMGANDQSRLEALCMVTGIGFVLFDPAHPNTPNWQIRVRAQRHQPDFFYVNEFARRLHESNAERFRQLFS